MRTLSVHLDYHMSTNAQFQRGSSQGIALPVKVLDAQGTVLADGVASLYRPEEFQIPDAYETVFVRLIWPSGKTETQKVVLSAPGNNELTFSDAEIARNEWSAWAIPRLNLHTPLTSADRPSKLNIGQYAKVWLRVWRLENSHWNSIPMTPSMQYKSNIARQIDMELERMPHLLQIGGSDVPWRFVALPGGGPCRVLLTPNNSKDPRADPLKVVVTSFRTDAETLLEFLARDSVRDANTMAGSDAMALELFEEKFNDPIAAVAGAYYLLRIENWERVPLSWWDNLSSNFNWIPDTAILHCVRLLRAGLGDEGAQTNALDLFKVCLDRGWPVYEEGLQLLQEAGSLLRHIAKREDAGYFAQVETLATAKTWAGAALSFYGREPGKPSAVLWVGMPNAPRRRRLANPDWGRDLIEKSLKSVGDKQRPTAAALSRQMSSLLFAQEFAPKKVTQLKKSSRPVSSIYSEQRLEAASNFAADSAKPKVTTIKEASSNDWMLLGDIGS